MPDLYCIIGPTASGKTAYAINLAKELDGEVISVDSRQIYRGMDIGTAKEQVRPSFNDDDRQWQESFLIEGIPHFLIDICLPSASYTAFDFKKQAAWLIADIQRRGKVPILAGGTGLYFEALLYDFQPASAQSSDPVLRAELENRYEQEGGETLWQELNAVDPVSAAKIHPNNGYYLVRALEVYNVTGQPKSAENLRSSKMVYDAKLIGMDWPRDVLYDRINQRIDEQMQAGLLDEVGRLRAEYNPALPAMTSIGYQELGQYLDGELELADAVELFKRNTRRYAKRQLTWLRRYEEVEWVLPLAYSPSMPMASGKPTDPNSSKI